MKILLIFILQLLSINLFGQQYEVQQRIDSLIIKDWGIINKPFGFSDNPIQEIILMYHPKITKQTYLNRHVDNHVDTTYIFNIENSQIMVHKVSSENFIIGALLMDNSIPLNLEFSVGLSKEQFKDNMKKYKLNNIPNYVRLQDMEIPEYFEIYFKNGKIYQIKFNGYTD